MTRKPTTKSPDERRLRKQIRHLLEVYTPVSQSPRNTDHIVREFLNIIDDEVRRTRMSIAPAVCWNPNDWLGHEPGPMTDVEYKERTHIKKALYAAALEGKLPLAVTNRDLHISVAPPKAWKDWADTMEREPRSLFTRGGKR